MGNTCSKHNSRKWVSSQSVFQRNYLAALDTLPRWYEPRLQAADVRIVRIQKYAQLEPPSECLALPTLQNAGQKQEDHWVTGFSLSRGGAQQATAQLSIGSGNSLAQPNQTGPCPAVSVENDGLLGESYPSKGVGNYAEAAVRWA